jgi:hypothetical protein
MSGNNSDFNDFNNWMNGDNSPDDYYMGPFNDKFKNMWNDWQKMQNDNSSNYMNFDDIMKLFHNMDAQNKRPINPKSRKPRQNPNMKMTRTVIMPDDYQRLLEIRGYLNITEQYAYVKTLDKILNSMNPFITEPPKDNK